MSARADKKAAEFGALLLRRELLVPIAEIPVLQRRAILRLAIRLNKEAGVQVCARCGCTNDAACAGGCGWATKDLCTRCAPREEQLQ